MLGGWDTTWYLDVARHGYAHDVGQVGEVFTNLAFFPLLPGVMAAALALGLNPFIAALVISNLAFLAALLGFHVLSVARFGERGRGAARPGPSRCSPPRPTPRWPTPRASSWRAPLGAALAGTRRAARPGRPRRRRRDPRAAHRGSWSRLLAGLLALRGPAAGRRAAGGARGAGRASWPWPRSWHGWRSRAARPCCPSRRSAAWDRGQVGIGLVTAAPSEISAGWDHVVSGDRRRRVARRPSGTWRSSRLYVWLLVRLWRSEGGLRSPWVAYSAAALALPLSSGTITSMARFGLLAFPLMWPLGEWLGAERGRAVRWAGAAVVVIALLVAQLTMRSP